MTTPGGWLDAVRRERPLVMNITNFVAMNFAANVLLAVGASPVMSHAREEVADMAAQAQALVLNIGTLEPVWVDAMHMAARTAAERRIPVVLDPVGVGATPFRTRVAADLLATAAITAVRGNAGELAALAGAQGTMHGVDAADAPPVADLTSWARAHDVLAIATGAVDQAADGTNSREVANGHPLMARVTATGCSLSALVGAFLAVAPPADRLDASVAALVVFGVAGETAARRASGPGTFVPLLLDALAALEPDQVDAAARITRSRPA